MTSLSGIGIMSQLLKKKSKPDPGAVGVAPLAVSGGGARLPTTAPTGPSLLSGAMGPAAGY